jgi:hypothetical protein
MRLELLNAKKLGTKRLLLGTVVPSQKGAQTHFKRQNIFLKGLQRQCTLLLFFHKRDVLKIKLLENEFFKSYYTPQMMFQLYKIFGQNILFRQ